MKKIIIIFLCSCFFFNKAFSNEKFSNWINSLGLEKTIFQDNIFYMGIGYDGEPNYLKNTFPILVSFIYDEVYSDDKRYVVRAGCKPRDCGNNGMLWVDLKEKVAIGVIDHSFGKNLVLKWLKIKYLFFQIFMKVIWIFQMNLKLHIQNG